MSEKRMLMTNKNKANSKKNTEELILELFKQKTTAVYKNQEDIANNILKVLKTERKQAAISKALKKLENKTINYKSVDYHIIKTEEGYKLYIKGDVKDEATQNFADKKVFEDYKVFVINKNILVYTVKEKYHEYVKNYMVKSFEENAFFDIISHSNKLYFLLNAIDGLYGKVYELPEIVKNIEENNQKKTLSPTKVIEKNKDHRLSSS